MEEEVENPWAVYGEEPFGSLGIGKIVQENRHNEVVYSLGIKYSEREPAQPWDPKEVHRFDNPVKAMAYFLVHKEKIFDLGYTKEKVIRRFLESFPSEKDNLENLLAQRQAKCTGDFIEDHCCPH